MELWRIWEFVFACAALLLNLFCAVIYGRLFSQRRRAIGFAFLAITCAVLVLTNAFSVIVQIRARLVFGCSASRLFVFSTAFRCV
jgi:hypothetical protein